MYIYEHILAKHYGWSLDQIRAMDLQDFYVHLRMCLVREGVDRDFQARIAGLGGGMVQNETKQITDIKRLPSGAIKKTESERFIGKNKVGELTIDKKGRVIRFDQPPLESSEKIGVKK